MPSTYHIRRVVRGLTGTSTINIAPKYRISLELGDTDLIFEHPVTTDPGKKERLQVLGLMKRPLNHPDCDACFAFSWEYFKTRIYKDELPAPPASAAVINAAAEILLNREVRNYLCSGGALPAQDEFAKLRTPGDYMVMHRMYDAVYEARDPAEMLYTLADVKDPLNGANRYKVEQQFFADNPALGRLPIVATVEKEKPEGGWILAPDVRVTFQLVKPEGQPGGASTGLSASHRVAGGNTRAPEFAPPLREGCTVLPGKATNPKPPRDGKRGPSAYMQRHVRAYAASKRKSANPQDGNAHFHLGGKAYMLPNAKDVCDTIAAGPNTRQNVFTLTPVARFHGASPLFKTSVADPAKHPYAVCADTNDAGQAGIIFLPSRIGGDRYQIKAYVQSFGKRFKCKTGVLTRWRTIRICRDIVMFASLDESELPPEIKTDFDIPAYTQCQHNSSERFCAACLTREGKVPEFDQDALTLQLAGAYCELILESRAETPEDMGGAAITADFRRALAEIQTDNTRNYLDASSQLFAHADGVQASITGTLPPNLKPGSVSIRVGGSKVEVPASGIFSGLRMDPPDDALDLTDGTIDHATGVACLNFSQPPPANYTFAASFTAHSAVDWQSLLYFPVKSPFMVNLRGMEYYNQHISPPFLPLAVQGKLQEKLLGVGDGTTARFSTTIPPCHETDCCLKLDESVAGTVESSGFTNKLPPFYQTSRINRLTGSVEVICLALVADELIITGDGVTTDFTCILKQPIIQLLSSAIVPLRVKAKTNDSDKPEILGGYTFHNQFRLGTLAAKGGTVNVNYAMREVKIHFPDAPALGQQIKVDYYREEPLPAGQRLSVQFSASASTGLPSVSPPDDNSIRSTVGNFIKRHWLIAMMRSLDDNKGFMPGIILMRSAQRDTWQSFKDEGLQGNGICHGVLMFAGKKYETFASREYETEDAGWRLLTDPNKIYNAILTHEMGHTLYINHFRSSNAEYPRDDLHDMYDNCLMGYDDNHGDFCGQCVAGLMGMNIHDKRLRTFDAKSYAPGAAMGMGDWLEPTEDLVKTSISG